MQDTQLSLYLHFQICVSFSVAQLMQSTDMIMLAQTVGYFLCHPVHLDINTQYNVQGGALHHRLTGRQFHSIITKLHKPTSLTLYNITTYINVLASM